MLNVNLENVQYNNITKVRLPIDGTIGNYGEFYATNDADAQPEDVVSGKIFYNSNGKQTGAGSFDIYRDGAVGPRIRVDEGAEFVQNMLIGLSSNFQKSSLNGDVTTPTIINSTNYTAGGNANNYKGVQIIDLGDGYQLILNCINSTNYTLSGVIIYTNQNSVVSAGTPVVISSSKYSGTHFSAIALTKRAASLEDLSTNKVFVCYCSENTNYYLTANILTINKTNKTFTVGTAVNLNSKKYSGCSSIDCTIMSYNSIGTNNDAWYILIGHSIGTAANVSSLNIGVTGVKVQINNNSDTITYGNSATTSIRPGTLTTDGNIKIIRVEDQFAGLFFNGDTTTLNLYTAGIICPESYNYYTNSITISTPTSLGVTKGGVTFDAICRTKKLYSDGRKQGDFTVFANSSGKLSIGECNIILNNNTITIHTSSFFTVDSYYTSAYTGGNSTQNYTQRIKALRVNLSHIFIFHSANSSSHLCYTEQIEDGTCNWRTLNDYTITYHQGQHVSNPNIMIDDSTNICRKMDACLSSYYGDLIFVFSYGSNLQLGVAVVKTGFGAINGYLGFSQDTVVGSFVETKFADNYAQTTSGTLTTPNKDKYIFKIDQ